jgi:hypothetical protein
VASSHLLAAPLAANSSIYGQIYLQTHMSASASSLTSSLQWSMLLTWMQVFECRRTFRTSVLNLGLHEPLKISFLSGQGNRIDVVGCHQTRVLSLWLHGPRHVSGSPGYFRISIVIWTGRYCDNRSKTRVIIPFRMIHHRLALMEG